MGKFYRINSQFELGVRLPKFEQDVVKNEPMFFSADPSFAWANGGPITKAFFKAIFGGPEVFSDGSERPNFLKGIDQQGYCFDSRVHMLMPGWYPAIPGWHHDDVPRTRSDGQPNYEDPHYQSKHVLALVNGDICPTEFAVGEVDMPHVDGVVYKKWHPIVEQDIKEGSLERVQVPSNQLVWFDHHSFHQASKAVGRGFRWFGRLSWDAGYLTGRPKFNEIRNQVNVYLEFPMEGW